MDGAALSGLHLGWPPQPESHEEMSWRSYGEREALAIAEHELRTPLATLYATVEILSEHPAIIGDDLRHLIGRLQNGVHWMNGLLDNLATWSAIRDDQLVLEERPVSVHEWLTATIDIVQPMLERRGQRVRLLCPTPAPLVLGDARRLGQVLANLLTNASRYSAAGDIIEIEVSADNGEVLVRVRDHGPGIPPAERDRIFERCFRGEQAAILAPSGQGLGLHIVRRLVELHGGAIGVESTVNQGTTFWFTFRQAVIEDIAA